MDKLELVSLITKALYLTLILSLPSILAATIVGTLVSIFQALTQVQEQNISFAFKLITMIMVIYMTLSWMGKTLYDYTLLIFEQMDKI